MALKSMMSPALLTAPPPCHHLYLPPPSLSPQLTHLVTWTSCSHSFQILLIAPSCQRLGVPVCCRYCIYARGKLTIAKDMPHSIHDIRCPLWGGMETSEQGPQMSPFAMYRWVSQELCSSLPMKSTWTLWMCNHLKWWTWLGCLLNAMPVVSLFL